MDVSQEVVDIIVANADKNDNDVLSLIVSAGVLFKDAKKTLAFVQVDKGLKLTKEQSDAVIADLMAGFAVSADSTVEEVNDQIELISAEAKISPTAARKVVRSAFDKEALTMPKALKAGVRSPSVPGFGGDVKLTADWVIANPNGGTYEEFKAYMEEKGAAVTNQGKDKTRRWFSVSEDLRVFISDYQAANS